MSAEKTHSAILRANEAFRLAGLPPLYPDFPVEVYEEAQKLLESGDKLAAQRFLLDRLSQRVR